jgi:hypothetical protein
LKVNDWGEEVKEDEVEVFAFGPLSVLLVVIVLLLTFLLRSLGVHL